MSSMFRANIQKLKSEILEIDNSVEAFQQFVIMRDCQKGGTVFSYRAKQQIQNSRFVFGIQVPSGLIGQNQPGLRQQGAAAGLKPAL